MTINIFCNKLPREFLAFPSLDILKIQLGSQATWSSFEVSPALSQALDHVSSRVPSNLNHSMMLYGMVVEETDILRGSKVVQVSGRPMDSEGLDTTLNLPPTSCVTNHS